MRSSSGASTDWIETDIGSLLRAGGGSIKTGPFGTALKASEYSRSGPPLISVGEIGYGRFTVHAETPRVPKEVTDRLPEYLLEAGDIVFARKGSVDRSAVVSAAEVGWFLGSDGIRLRPPSCCCALFLSYHFRSPATRSWLLQHATGSTMASLNQGTIERVPIRLPPLTEQRAIAAVLGALDEKINANRHMNATLEALARNIYASTPAEDFFDATLGELCEVFDGPHATPNTVDEGPIFLGISNLSDGQLDLSDTRHVTEEDYTRWTRRVTPSFGDVLFSYETRLGQAAWLPAGIKCCLGRRMGILRADAEKVPPIILLHAYLSRAFQETIREKTVHGSTVDRIPLVEMPSFAIPIPSPERCGLIAPVLLALRDRICVNAATMDTLDKLRDLLLPKLLSGLLRVRDAEHMIGDAA